MASPVQLDRWTEMNSPLAPRAFGWISSEALLTAPSWNEKAADETLFGHWDRHLCCCWELDLAGLNPMARFFFLCAHMLSVAVQQIYNRSDTFWLCFVATRESLQTALLLSVTYTVRSLC